MFKWEKQRQSLNTSTGRILRIERSIADIQVSLPGLTPDDACAYICVYRDDEGIRVAVVLHLLQSDQLAFYMNDEGPLDSEAAGRVLGDGLFFAESLGFTMGNLDFQRLSREQQAELSSTLAFSPAAGQSRKVMPLQAAPRPEVKTDRQGDKTAAPAQAAVNQVVEPPPRPVPQNIERRPPSAVEMQQRRQAFIQNLGRLLGML